MAAIRQLQFGASAGAGEVGVVSSWCYVPKFISVLGEVPESIVIVWVEYEKLLCYLLPLSSCNGLSLF